MIMGSSLELVSTPSASWKSCSPDDEAAVSIAVLESPRLVITDVRRVTNLSADNLT